MIKTGRVVKGIGGFYYVSITDFTIECKAKGSFKNKKIKLLVGDIVDVDIETNNIVKIYNRKNELIRPAVANVDQIVLFMSISYPKPDFSVIDRILINNMYHNIDTILVFNKIDEVSDEEILYIKNIYKNSGIKTFFISAINSEFSNLVSELDGKLNVLSGNSGVGKSTFINNILNRQVLEIGEISEKIKRGKHTTRHSEIFQISENTYITDTPGYGKIDLLDIDLEKLSEYYNEFNIYKNCKFNLCTHTHEPDCDVKNAVFTGKISSVRYDNYFKIYKEIKEKNNAKY